MSNGMAFKWSNDAYVRVVDVLDDFGVWNVAQVTKVKSERSKEVSECS